MAKRGKIQKSRKAPKRLPKSLPKSMGKKKSKQSGKKYLNPIMSQFQFEKELKMLRKIHSPADHKKEQKIINDVKKIEFLHIPTDKEIRTEIDRLHKIEKEAASLLHAEPANYPKLEPAKDILKREAKAKKKSKHKRKK